MLAREPSLLVVLVALPQRRWSYLVLVGCWRWLMSHVRMVYPPCALRDAGNENGAAGGVTAKAPPRRPPAYNPLIAARRAPAAAAAARPPPLPLSQPPAQVAHRPVQRQAAPQSQPPAPRPAAMQVPQIAVSRLPPAFTSSPVAHLFELASVLYDRFSVLENSTLTTALTPYVTAARAIEDVRSFSAIKDSVRI